jgi:hypothetical protein
MERFFVRTAAGLACVAAIAGADAQVVSGTREGLTRANSIYGPTGLIRIPTAYVVDEKTIALSASFGRNIRVPAANYGIFRYIEVGGAFVDREGGSNKAIANAKVSIIPSNFRWFEIGVGVIDAVDAIKQTIYFVASADLVPPNWDVPERGLETMGLKAHLGAGTGLFGEKAFGGAEVLFNKKLSLIGEWDTEDLNAAIRYAPTNYLRIQLGVQGKDIHFSATTTFNP